MAALVPISRKVLVLGSAPRTALSIVRSLGRAGIAVDLAWCLPGEIVAVSRYVRRLVELVPGLESEGWLAPLKALLEREKYDLVIPAADAQLIPLVLARRDLEPLAKLAIPPEHAFQTAYDKFKITELAASLGIRVPRFAILDKGDRLPADFPVPCVLKPESSYDITRTATSRRFVQHAFSRPEADDVLSRMLPAGPVMAQAYFVGRGVGVEILAKEGQVLAAFQHERLHEAPEGSGSTYRQSVPLDPELLEASRSLVKALNYTGALMVEYKRNATDWMFVEINARFWGSLPLGLAAGSDMPLFLYQMMVEGRRDFDPKYKTFVRSRNFLDDLSWFRRNWRADHGNPNLITVPRVQSIFDFVPMLLGRDHLDYSPRDDRAPGRRALAARGVATAEKLRARLAPSRADLVKSGSILFLCKGNICRSPFAEAKARAKWPGKAITSAGTYPKSDRSSPPEAIEAARALGIDLDRHRSRFADRETLARHETIVVFDPDQAVWMRANYPDLAGRMAYLDGVIPDPLGRPLSDFLACYRRIGVALDR
jgi:protein-tyrosine-phosphatase/predicted ATP-grasp superfamily ATP-dependent carboligase